MGIDIKKRDYTNIPLMNLCKLFFAGYFINSLAISEVVFYIPYLSTALFALSVICFFMARATSLDWFQEIKFLVLLAGIAFLSGFFVAIDFYYMTRHLQSFLVILIVGYIIFGISRYDNSIDFFCRVFLISTLILSMYLVMFGGITHGIGRISTSESMNTNTLGVLSIIGTWCALRETVLGKKGAIIRVVFALSCSAVYLYTIILTGSRKSFIGFIFIIVLWLLFCVSKQFVKASFLKKTLILVGISLFIFIIINRFGSYFVASSGLLMDRMEILFDNTWKWNLIKDAFSVFLKSPLFGVGFDNYRFVSIYKLYSHCTYAEIFACTGVFGAALFLYVLYLTGKKLIYIMAKEKDAQKKLYNTFVLILFIFLLYIGVGQIIFYNRNLMNILFMLIAFCYIQQKKAEKDEAV